jgi:hypothetical protein
MPNNPLDPTQADMVADPMQQICNCGHSKGWHSLSSAQFVHAASGCLFHGCSCRKFAPVADPIASDRPDTLYASEETLLMLRKAMTLYGLLPEDMELAKRFAGQVERALLLRDMRRGALIPPHVDQGPLECNIGDEDL